MPDQLWLTAFLNKYLAGLTNAVLAVFHVHARHPQAPITNYVAMQMLVFVLLLLWFAVVRARLSVDNPGALQHTMEGIDALIAKQGEEIIGHGSERYTATDIFGALEGGPTVAEELTIHNFPHQGSGESRGIR